MAYRVALHQGFAALIFLFLATSGRLSNSRCKFLASARNGHVCFLVSSLSPLNLLADLSTFFISSFSSLLTSLTPEMQCFCSPNILPWPTSAPAPGRSSPLQPQASDLLSSQHILPCRPLVTLTPCVPFASLVLIPALIAEYVPPLPPPPSTPSLSLSSVRGLTAAARAHLSHQPKIISQSTHSLSLTNDVQEYVPQQRQLLSQSPPSPKLQRC